jgi:hypothetical protein
MTDLEKEHCGVYLQLLQGFADGKPEKVLKLKKSLCGL